MSSNNCKKPTVSYTMFLYRAELQRRRRHYMRLSKAKFILTDELISKNVRNLNKCSQEDLKSITHQLCFKRELSAQLHRLRRLEKMGFRNANPNMESTEL